MENATGQAQEVNIVSFSVPYPAIYGGVIDIYYRLKALKDLGVAVHLHCFTYEGSIPADKLDELCASVTYYRRKTGLLSHLRRTPYIIASRRSAELVENLARSRGPILYEGIHTCADIDDRSLVGRARYIRMHNVEWEYYLFLSQTTRSWWKRIHFLRESRRLRRAERRMLKHATGVFAISQNDLEYFANLHPAVTLLRPFHQFEDISILPGEGDYVLMLGDMSIEDNFSSIYHLALLCSELGLPLKIAGRSPATPDRQRIEALPNIDLHFDVGEDEMYALMQNAQIHVIHSSISSGFKLKLIAALFTARHIVARKVLVSKLLREVVETYSDVSEIGPILQALMVRPVARGDIAKRKNVLLPRFSNQANARLLLETINANE